jgi:hypothetical protein
MVTCDDFSSSFTLPSRNSAAVRSVCHVSHCRQHVAESLLQAIDRRMVVALDMQTDKANARADGPSLDRASALAGMYNHAGNHHGMPCALGPS